MQTIIASTNRSPHQPARFKLPVKTSRASYRVHNLNVTRRYSLRWCRGLWQLNFEGEQALFKHEQGVPYVAYLLTHPPERPIHGLALMASVVEPGDAGSVTTTVADPATGECIIVGRTARIQERNLALDDAEAAAALRRTQLKLEAVLDDENESEPVRAEAARDLEAIYEYQRANAGRTLNRAEKAADAVRKAITRFQKHLAEAVDVEGKPVAVLRSFAKHIKEHLLIPSGRACGQRRSRSEEGYGGCFTYEPPQGVVWRVTA